MNERKYLEALEVEMMLMLKQIFKQNGMAEHGLNLCVFSWLVVWLVSHSVSHPTCHLVINLVI
jgi:hypothetical protein